MRKIVTVSREFGSGGREVAKRLADSLNIEYIDNEIIAAIAKETRLDEAYLSDRLESVPRYSLTFAHSFANISQTNNSAMLIAKQHNIIKEIADKKDCVIVGRGADAILSDYKPFNIFVYADMPSKIARCKSRMASDENLSDKAIERKIKNIDSARKSTHDLYAAYKWGDKVGYNLCINTTGMDIKTVIPPLTAIIENYFK